MPDLRIFSPNYKPSPQPVRIYSGPIVPNAYDPNWQYFTNLTKDQIAWFQAQPEWSDFVAYVAAAGPSATINANVTTATINATISAGAVKLNVGPISK